MRQLLLYIYCLCFALSSLTAQSNVIINDSTMFIGSEVDSLTEEQRYFNPIYLVVQKGKEHLKQLLIRGSVCDCDTTLPNRRIGVFSIAPDKHVTFSQGNLQHFPAANLWKFADNQYEYLGNANKYLSPSYRNWTDLFAWNTSEQGDFLDWGSNEICGDAPHTWRTLTKDEWDYLMYNRPSANMLRTKGSINGHRGIILLPDNYWQIQRDFNITFIADNNNLQSNVNTFTEDKWKQLEDIGAVFLPAAGTRRLDATVAHTNIFGGYWSSTSKNTASSFLQCFHVAPCSYSNYSNLGYGRSVRLVQDTILPTIDSTAIPAPAMIIPINDTLSINLMQVQKGNFMMGAADSDKKADKDERPQHPVTITYDYYIMQTEVTQGLWEAIMGQNIHDLIAKSRYPEDVITHIGSEYPVCYVYYNDCLAFIERLNQRTGLQFRMPTEAEWEYAARGGHRSKGYLYAGSNNPSEVAVTNHKFKPVASLKPNELGIYDMSGNISEMTNDYALGESVAYPSAEPQTNPRQIAPITKNRMTRNSHTPNYDSVRITQRYPYTPTWCRDWLGFRLVMVPDYFFKTIAISNSVHIDMSFVKGGTFIMGDSTNANTSPTHQVTLSDYYIAQTEVTQELWKAIMGTTPNSNTSKYAPVGNVSWNDCQGFIEKLNKHTGLHFRLPTEAEWEYAARGGQYSHGYKYAGSNDIDHVAWYAGNANSQLHIIGTKQPNELGIYDMSGNSWEWCADYYGAYSDEYQTNPQGPNTGTGRVLRGGSFNTTAAQRCAVTYRQNRTEDYPDTHISFRLVLDLPHTPDKVITINDSVSINMISVEGGTFTMGKGKDAHPVTLSDYYIAQTELTQAQWEAVMNEKATDYKQNEIFGDNYPMASISLADCQRFVDTLNQRTGLHFRIPTEAEWEYAAKGGKHSRGYTFSGSDNIHDVTILKGEIRTDENGNDIYHPEPVMSCKPNELGIYDMTGNLTEWVSDWYAPYNTYPQINPTGAATYPTDNRKIIYRGGCWTFAEENCLPTYRHPFPNRPANGIGFRLALSDEEPFKMIYLNDTIRICMRSVDGNYYMQETEVTQELWNAVMSSNPSKYKDNSLPVTNVSWNDCQAFITQLNQLTGLHFRLPYEAEWDNAAKGGNKSQEYTYAGSNDINEVAWYLDNAKDQPAACASKKPNELGMFDMTGNVWEWCLDSNNRGYLLCGGAYDSAASACKIPSRAYRPATHLSHFSGFRLLLEHE